MGRTMPALAARAVHPAVLQLSGAPRRPRRTLLSGCHRMAADLR